MSRPVLDLAVKEAKKSPVPFGTGRKGERTKQIPGISNQGFVSLVIIWVSCC